MSYIIIAVIALVVILDGRLDFISKFRSLTEL